MADGRRNNGGHSTKGHAGRKTKADEQKLLEKLKPYDDKVLQVLINNVMDNESWAVKMFMDYRYGKPKERLDVTTNGNDINLNINYAGTKTNDSSPEDLIT